MSKLHKKTGSTCMICDEKPDKSIIFHKTRRQTHMMCLDCGIGYLKPIITIATNNVRKNIRVDSGIIRCPGSVKGQTRNMCKHVIELGNLEVPDCEISIDIFRLIYVIQNDNSYICPESKCGQVVEVDSEYIGNQIVCQGGCMASWCIHCMVSPFHTGKSCIEVEAESMNTENGKMIWELKTKGKLKFCPCCRSPCIKNDGCNKMVCASCHKNWCWLCLSPNIDYNHYNSSNVGQCTGKLWQGVDVNGNALPEEDLPGEDLPGEDLPGEDLPEEDLPGVVYQQEEHMIPLPFHHQFNILEHEQFYDFGEYI